MASNGTKARPYRKASEYLVQSRRNPESLEPKSSIELENEKLRLKVHALTRRYEIFEAEHSQTKEYLEGKIRILEEKYNALDKSYTSLKIENDSLINVSRQLIEKESKIKYLEEQNKLLAVSKDKESQNLYESKLAYTKLQQENERLRKDCNLAVGLLKCNESSYKVKKKEELPDELRRRVEETSSVALQHYNEYINPYDDIDEISDDETSTNNNEVSMQDLAKVLEKVENVHMSLKEDCSSENQLNAPYNHVDKKLDNNEELAINKLPPPPSTTSKKSSPQQESSSPWQQRVPDKQPSKPAELDSIWQMAPSSATKQSSYYEEEEISAGGAYGVYSMPMKKKNRPKKPMEKQNIDPIPQVLVEQKEELRPSSPDDFEFKKPLTGSPEKTSNKSSTNESTPRHEARKEAASGEEKVSLLDDEGEVAEVELEIEETVEVHNEEEQEVEGIDLEWDSTLHHHNDVTTSYVDVTVHRDDVIHSQPDLLLSYNDAQTDKTEITPRQNKEVKLLEDIFGEDASAEGERLKSLLTSSNPHDNDEGVEGSVLLLEGLVKTPPPPPQQFASTEESDSDVTSDLRSSSVSPVKRKSSLERAQKFGNVLD